MGAWEHGSIETWVRRRRFFHAPVRPCSSAPMRPRAPARAFTLVEVILTVLIVGVGTVASMRALPVILKISRASHQGLVAQRLATDLLAEISLLPFEDPDGSPKFGPEADESKDTRADFDDIDDYNQWKAAPPQKKDGSTEPGCPEYARAVSVASVKVWNFTEVVSPGSSDAKLITITVTREGMTPVTVATVRLKGANREDPE